jgi:tetratricopeptide (TPR) repeat protein
VTLLPAALVLLLVVFVFWSWCVDTGTDEAATGEAAAGAAGGGAAGADATAASRPAADREAGAAAGAASAPAGAETGAAASGTTALGELPAELAGSSQIPRNIPEYQGPLLPPSATATDPNAEALAMQSLEHWNAGRFAEALQQADAALARSPGNARYEALRARILHALKREQEALTQLDQAVQHDPLNAALYRQRASVNLALARQRDAGYDIRAAERVESGAVPQAPP